MTIYGYARVSSTGQNEDRQIIELTNAGVDAKHIYIDHKSGRDFNRPQWQRMVKRLRRGDLLVVPSIDRMGRNFDEIREEWRHITRIKRVDIRVLNMKLLDTSASVGNLIGRFTAEIVLSILAYFAQTEREAIHERQRQGIAAARSRGVKFGRPRIALPADFHIIARDVKTAKLSYAEGARRCNMNYSTFRAKVRQLTASQQI